MTKGKEATSVCPFPRVFAGEKMLMLMTKDLLKLYVLPTRKKTFKQRMWPGIGKAIRECIGKELDCGRDDHWLHLVADQISALIRHLLSFSQNLPLYHPKHPASGPMSSCMSCQLLTVLFPPLELGLVPGSIEAD
ncbi:hypothetical protein TURU_160498 [Turdus rufiventris]|nr:hypothetical protein TURU_160498 [Turdus rufiventris]